MKKPVKNIVQKPQPLVSVIIPVFNAAAYIGEAVSSILAQTYKNIELIIIDDGSTDDSLAIIKKLQAGDRRITIFTNHRNLGAGASRKLAIEKSRGDYILWQDADDYSHPARLQQLLTQLQKEKNLSAIGSGFYIVRGKKITTGGNQTASVDKNKNHFKIHFPTLLARTSTYRNIPYRPFTHGEDADWCYRLLAQGGKVKNIATPLYYYRKHGTGLTSNHFQKFVCGMMVRLAKSGRAKNLPDPFDGLPLIDASHFAKFYDKKIYQSLQTDICHEINWFLLENSRQMLTRPWFFYKYLFAIGRFFKLGGWQHFFLTLKIFLTRLPINIIPYIITRKIIF